MADPNRPSKDPTARWRAVADFAKRRTWAMRIADRLGRGKGRFRWRDGFRSGLARPRRPDLSGWASRDLAAVAVGHATVLLRVAGQTVLTDPVFAHRIGLGGVLFTMGPRRQIAPAISIRDLPPIDVVLLTHAHFDHLDRPTLARLPKRASVVTAKATGDLVADLGYRDVRELDRGETTRVGDLSITAVACRHWSPRVFHDDYRGYNAYVLEGRGRRVLFAGDTAMYDGFAACAPVDLAIFGIGAYDPFIHAHATPEQAYQMAGDAQARWVMPMHYGVFKLSHEPMDEPIRRFRAAEREAGPQIVAAEVGGQFGL